MPACHTAHEDLAPRTDRPRIAWRLGLVLLGLLPVGGSLPGVLLGGSEHGLLPEQGSNPVELDFGGGMKPAEGALGQRNVAIGVARAGANMQEQPFRIDILDFQPKSFAQAQAAGVKGHQRHAMVQGWHFGQDAAHFGGREHHRQFVFGIGPD